MPVPHRPEADRHEIPDQPRFPVITGIMPVLSFDDGHFKAFAGCVIAGESLLKIFLLLLFTYMLT